MSSPFRKTLIVWKAIFLKDALSRFFGSRAAWVWLLLEPSIHVVFVAFIYTIINSKSMQGVPVQPWLAVGMLSFFVFRRTAVQVLHSIDCSKPFFAFREVRPFDAALCRGGVEAFAMLFVSLIIAAALAVAGFNMFPDDIISCILAYFGLWFLGLGYGLISSVSMRLVPDSGFILQLLMMPMYIISGVMMPVAIIPEPYRGLLLINPVLHGVEAMRIGFWGEFYHQTGDISMAYLYAWALVLVVIGMALYQALETRLVRQ